MILIGAVWCPSCLTMEKILKKANISYKHLDIDNDEEEINKLNIGDIEKLPVLVYNNHLLVGEHSLKEIEAFMEESK